MTQNPSAQAKPPCIHLAKGRLPLAQASTFCPRFKFKSDLASARGCPVYPAGTTTAASAAVPVQQEMPGYAAPPPAPQPLQQQRAVPSQAVGVTGPSAAPAQACRPRRQAAKLPALQPAKGEGGAMKRGSPATRLGTTGGGVSKPTPRPRRACSSMTAAQSRGCPQGQGQRKQKSRDSNLAPSPQPQGPPPAPQPLQQQHAVPSQAAGVTGPSTAPAQACRPRRQAVKHASQPAKGEGCARKRGSAATGLRTTGGGVSKPTPRPRRAGTSMTVAQPRNCPQAAPQRTTTRSRMTTRARLAAASQPAAPAPAEGQQRRPTDAEQFAAAANHGAISAPFARAAAAGAASRSCRACQRRW